MIWFFERTSEILELETRYDNATAEYVLEQRRPGVPPLVERFKDAASFRERLVAIETDLGGQRWAQRSSPAILSHGWPDTTPQH
jgi:hypothetical protein